MPVTFGQQVWPGDINNNGIVNNVDMLYWAVANDASGDARQDTTNDWMGQNLPANLWEKNFPNGLNYAFADCNGDGKVNEADRQVLIKNFGLVHGEVSPDEFTTGEPTSDPILLLDADTTTISPRGALNADLSLGTETDTISKFYGIAFSVVYDPNVVGKKPNDFRFTLRPNTWLNGKGNNKAIQFVMNDSELGVAQVAIIRKDQVAVSGFGDIGTFSIVMEDIVFFNSSVSNTDIKLVNDELAEMMAAPSEVIFSVDSLTTTPTVQLIRQKGLKLYPNPAPGEQITIEMDNPEERIRQVQLFDTNGRLLSHQKFGGLQSKEAVKIGDYPAGIYTFKVVTDQHLYVRSFLKQ